MFAGMALMNPTSFLFEDTLTPQCHWRSQPGGRRALKSVQARKTDAVSVQEHRDRQRQADPPSPCPQQAHVTGETHHSRNSGE